MNRHARLMFVALLGGPDTEPPKPLPPQAADVLAQAEAAAKKAPPSEQVRLPALQRLHADGPREPLVARLTLYATEATAALLAEWASDPALPRDVASQAQRSAEAVRRAPR